MANETDAVELATYATLYASAIAVLSRGQPLGAPQVDAIARALEVEQLPPQLIDGILGRARKGLLPEQVPANSALGQEQAILLVVTLVQFSARVTPNGDPLLPVIPIAAKYGLPRDAVYEVSRVLRKLESAVPVTSLDESLRFLAEPPDEYEAIASQIHRRLFGAAERRSVARVSPSRIQHPDDVNAFAELETIPGLRGLAELVMKHGHEKVVRVANVASRIRVGPQQFPGLYELYEGCVQRSGVTPEPSLYIQTGGINAFTDGVDDPFIVLSSGAVSLLSRSELEFILGHELGHVRFRHVHALEMARFIPRASSLFVGAKLITAGLELALLDWERKAELSADRLGLLVCQNRDAALRVMMKLSGVPAALYREMNVDAFLAQHAEYEDIGRDAVGKVMRAFGTMGLTHPWTVVRAHELHRWVASGEYQALLDGVGTPGAVSGSVAAVLAPLHSFVCPVCAKEVSADRTRCQACSAPVTERDRLRACPRCGSSVRPGLHFCEQCGGKIGTKDT